MPYAYGGYGLLLEITLHCLYVWFKLYVVFNKQLNNMCFTVHLHG